ncbi:dihydrofolate reductase [Tepidamorphus gemmatus]|uniref:Dihydrofolate reductase n=1 Tax=Tepidamorphus gemmatus TaxID=747076 RepID=A0A4R3MAB2_9HYPH|nr:dihydrofolate reductase [Tepidamorphus gemmatus]TCT08345.1 dihydrofolate reductase [Tepidamorphus gemmatus]
MTAPRLSLIAAVAGNGVIGRNNELPWRLPSDLKHFKAVTMGRPVIMGRKTFESIGRPLPGRDNIVVTRSETFDVAQVHAARSLDEAERLAANFARRRGVDEIFVIGGGQLYAEAIGRARRLYITEVAGQPDGDTRFPEIDPAIWRAVSRQGPMRGATDTAAMTFVVYERIAT